MGGKTYSTCSRLRQEKLRRRAVTVVGHRSGLSKRGVLETWGMLLLEQWGKTSRLQTQYARSAHAAL